MYPSVSLARGVCGAFIVWVSLDLETDGAILESARILLFSYERTIFLRE